MKNPENNSRFIDFIDTKKGRWIGLATMIGTVVASAAFAGSRGAHAESSPVNRQLEATMADIGAKILALPNSGLIYQSEPVVAGMVFGIKRIQTEFGLPTTLIAVRPKGSNKIERIEIRQSRRSPNAVVGVVIGRDLNTGKVAGTIEYTGVDGDQMNYNTANPDGGLRESDIVTVVIDQANEAINSL